MEICLICSSDKDDNGLVICSECKEQENEACGACGEWKINVFTGKPHDCSEEMTLKGRLVRVIEILSTPQDSDDIWYCVGQLEAIVKEINAEKAGA